jgi:hypothetical protein
MPNTEYYQEGCLWVRELERVTNFYKDSAVLAVVDVYCHQHISLTNLATGSDSLQFWTLRRSH